MADFHSDRMNAELPLSTCTSDSRTSTSHSSSTLSSPDNRHHPPSHPPPPPPPLQPAADQSFNIHMWVAPVMNTSTTSQPCRSRKEVLKSLRESIPHALKRQRLQESEKEHQKDASLHKKARRRLSKELYVILSLYALMQGAVFAAVAQSSVFTCGDWWGPLGFAVLVALGTIRGVLDKLRRMGYEQMQVKAFERRASAVYDRITHLYWKGAACNLDELELPDDQIDRVDVGGDDSQCIFSAHGVFVLGFLGLFSLLILLSCLLMLCWQRPCHCKAS